MNKKLNKSLRLVCVIALWLVLIVACLRAYNLYQYDKVHPQKEYSWSSWSLPPEEFTIDIKPGSDPNPINRSSKGVIPVAILTTDAFDASTIDPTTAMFEGASPVRWKLSDVDHDGDLDLLLHFRTQETSIADGQVVACLTATTFDGVTLQGCDSIKVVPAKGGGNHGGLLALGAPLAFLGIGLGRNALGKMGRRLRRHA